MMNIKKRSYDTVSGNKTQNRSKKLSKTKARISRISNVFNEKELEILVNEARKHVILDEVRHGDDSSKRFCYNALARCEGNQIILTKVDPILTRRKMEWFHLDEDIREAIMRGIGIAINEGVKLGEKDPAVHDEYPINFELIYVPINSEKGVPGLEWHCDEGYDPLSEEAFCYADSTTVFALTDPKAWIGGNLQLRVKDAKKFETLRYECNGAITFINKRNEHRVTLIRPRDQASSERIVLIVSIYDKEDWNSST